MKSGIFDGHRLEIGQKWNIYLPRCRGYSLVFNIKKFITEMMSKALISMLNFVTKKIELGHRGS